MDETDKKWMTMALRLARRGAGETSPNPAVGAVIVRGSKLLASGWHRRAGQPHAEIEALRDARQKGHRPRNSTLYVTLEPCCTHGRTPPCVDAILESGIRRVVVAAIDPNPKHACRGIDLLRKAGIAVTTGVLEENARELNESFNHWIVHRTPWVTAKIGMSLDGKIALQNGESQWITGSLARREAMQLRQQSDAILVGVGTVIADNPSLTYRSTRSNGTSGRERFRVILDPMGRTPIDSRVLTDPSRALTLIIVSPRALERRKAELAKRAQVIEAQMEKSGSSQRISLQWLMKELGARDISSLLVEGGGETLGEFFRQEMVQRVVFFYGAKVLGGFGSLRAVAGDGFQQKLSCIRFKKLGSDLRIQADVHGPLI